MKKLYIRLPFISILISIFSLAGIRSAAQTTLAVGDIAFTGYIAADNTLPIATPDQFSFLLLVPITINTTILFTDNGWRPNLNAFDAAETVFSFKSTVALAAGKEILMVAGATTATLSANSGGGTAGDITIVSGISPFSLNGINGDQIFAFQGSAASPSFISGFHSNVYTIAQGDPTNTDATNWDGASLPQNPNTSGKPAALTTGTNAIWIGTTGVGTSEQGNARFNCSGTLTTAAGVRAAIYAGTAPNTFSNWIKDDGPATFTMPSNCVYLSTPAPAITLQPTLQNKCSGTSTNFTVNATNTTSFQWESAVSPFTTWTQVNNGGVFTVTNGSGTSTLAISNVAGLDGRQYRCVATGSTAPAANSNGALLTVYPLPSLTNASTASACTGTGPNITLTSSVPSSFAWTLGTNIGSITGASASSGATINQTLTNPSTNTAGSIVYNVTPTSTTGSCPGSSSPITVTVNFPTSITQHPANTAVCSGGVGTTSFTVAGIGAGIGFTWQADIGLGFQNISNSGIFSGATTGTLTITNPTAIFNGAIFRGVATGTCGTVNSNNATLVFDPAGQNTWTGAVNNTYENAGNWRCGTVPDLNTDVIIPTGSVITLNSDRSCRTITVRPGASFTAKTGFKLTVVH